MAELPSSYISNPLVTAEQLRSSASQLDGIGPELERSLRFHGSLLTQAAGIILRLNQDIIAQAIVLFCRFFVGAEGGSFRLHGVKDISAASLYLTAKLSVTPQTTRAVLNAYAYLLSPVSPLLKGSPTRLSGDSEMPDPVQFTLSEGDYLAQREMLMKNEVLVLRHVGFTTKTMLPHALALTYVQTICSAAVGISSAAKRKLASRTVALLNAALLSPQVLYLTHQPHALAVAAVYLAARDVGCKIGGGEWWLIWDVSREGLGFLVLAMRSVEAWVAAGAGTGLWSVEEVEAEIARESNGRGATA